MTKLTKIYDNGIITLDASQFPPIDQNVLDSNINNSEPVKAAVAKLAEFEDAEENGLLVCLPCKVGDTIYMIVTKASKSRNTYSFIKKTTLSSSNIFYVIRDFGKSVFLTREEAERALEARDSK